MYCKLGEGGEIEEDNGTDNSTVVESTSYM
jgi:hypothetical protein